MIALRSVPMANSVWEVPAYNVTQMVTSAAMRPHRFATRIPNAAGAVRETRSVRETHVVWPVVASAAIQRSKAHVHQSDPIATPKDSSVSHAPRTKDSVPTIYSA